MMKKGDLFREIEEGFHRHRGSGTVFVQGEATGLDLSARVARINIFGKEGVKRASIVGKRGSRNLEENLGGKTQLIPYHALIMATGSSAHSELLSLHGTHLNTIGTLTAFHARAAAARSIVVCGGGPSGVECAGQLATYLNFSGRGPFRRKVKAQEWKAITLITGGDRCLPALKAKVGLHAERKLKRLGVEIRYGVRVLAAKENSSSLDGDGLGRTRITLNDDSTLTADLLYPLHRCGTQYFLRAGGTQRFQRLYRNRILHFSRRGGFLSRSHTYYAASHPPPRRPPPLRPRRLRLLQLQLTS